MANETELAEELAWAMNRPDVKKRHAEGAVSHGGFHDEPGSFLCALNTSDRKRLEEFKDTCKFCVVDVKHDVDHTMERKLNTIVAQVFFYVPLPARCVEHWPGWPHSCA